MHCTSSLVGSLVTGVIIIHLMAAILMAAILMAAIGSGYSVVFMNKRRKELGK